MALWQSPDLLGDAWTYRQGGVLLGRVGDRLLGRADDRHMVTIAGSRAGKSQTVLIPNLQRYPGPAVVIDPKGELYAATAARRQALGHRIVLLNPFNVGGLGSHGHNPFRELAVSNNLAADAAQIADALIIPPEKGDAHWTDSAKNLITGLILHALTTDPAAASIPQLRAQLSDPEALEPLFDAMAGNTALGGTVQNIGRSMLGKCEINRDGSRSFTRELGSIISAAAEQTRPLDEVRPALDRHDFDLAELAGEQPVTVYLVLPAMRIATHHRWLRLFIYQVLAALERQPIPRGRLPLWLVLEEFAALGNLRSVEAAAGYMAGFGVKLWAILQDLTQLRHHYPHTWETFLGNAGLIQAFGNVDVTTTKYLSELLGQTVIEEEKRSFVSAAARDQGDIGVRRDLRSAPLLAPAEITLYFARETQRQLVLVPGELPVYMQRLPYEQRGQDEHRRAKDQGNRR